MNNLNDKIKASMMFLSYFDTLGFNNSMWEFNFNTAKLNDESSAIYIWNLILHQYYAYGGNNINISKWIASDDTILSIIISEGCLNGGKESDYFKSFKKYNKNLNQDERHAGVNTINTLKKLYKLKDVEKINYDSSMGGNGAAIRTSPIGLIYYQDKDLDKLLHESILSSRMTHNYPLGFLSGIVTALFTSYAIRNINPELWCDKLLKLNESGKIDKIIKKTSIYKKYLRDKDEFWNVWYEYKEKRLDGFDINKDKFNFSSFRIKDLKKYTLSVTKSNDYSKWGASGVGALIIAYDSLRLSTYFVNKEIIINIDSLIYFAVLHFGDNDSTGAIVGAWLGAFNGFKNFDKTKMEQLEFYKKLENISENIYKKIK